MADAAISHPASVATDIPLADCKPEMMLHRRACRLARMGESIKRERRHSKAEEAKYRAVATEELADELSKLTFVQLKSGYLYALDTTEQAMREAREVDARLDA
jgi:hypothetical protein